MLSISIWVFLCRQSYILTSKSSLPVFCLPSCLHLTLIIPQLFFSSFHIHLFFSFFFFHSNFYSLLVLSCRMETDSLKYLLWKLIFQWALQILCMQGNISNRSLFYKEKAKQSIWNKKLQIQISFYSVYSLRYLWACKLGMQLFVCGSNRLLESSCSLLLQKTDELLSLGFSLWYITGLAQCSLLHDQAMMESCTSGTIQRLIELTFSSFYIEQL